MTDITPPPSQQIPTVDPVYAQRCQVRNNSRYPQLWQVLDGVYDPELPGVTIWDLGILQQLYYVDDVCVVSVSPTYSGCPAVDTICDDILKALKAVGVEKVTIEVVLQPAWTTAMISPKGKQQLAALQIAPPHSQDQPDCPVCHSHDTQVLSQFGSTACKALYRCTSCSEVFDYFKRL